jgi:hypothetical protein
MSVIGIFFALATATSSAPAVSNSDSDNAVRCVREDVTGSLARTRKVCHTVGEWRRISAASNDEVRRIVQPGTANGQNN